MTTKPITLSLALAPLALVACTAAEPLPEDIPVIEAPVNCTATDYEQYVGQTSPQISIPAGTQFRHYRTGDPLTMDLSPNRLNFEYDRTGKLIKVSCG
ncbi:I78 family peptidase inhibitor [Paracoccus sp. M683]|uniref:I78 family peptidase inhibitor n=1 Tax=Paracoccus sp. M683 TaxID=2594268 RepID=UPI00163D8F2F|nr:I78 family peptidase inhibitor [Paracoccus sp. M683]